ncbi:MAG: helix-turn-helix transcriptional regulator [Bacteroidota bacterium]
MAIDSFECKIITGGFNHCNSSWNKTSDELDRCFKIYHPVGGSAIINVDNKEYLIESGNVYFISGFNIVSQKCTSFMDIYWLHFVPTSLYLKHLLLGSKPVHIRDNNTYPFLNDFDKHIGKLFGNSNFMSSEISSLPYSFEETKLHSYILNFIADIIKDTPENNLTASGEIIKLNPSIKFMNDEFKSNPSLEEIALKSNLAPNYFHRVFKKNFGVTPFDFMLRQRMEHAIKLLTTTNKSVKEVAFESGYNNEFYFYRQFKKQFNYSPGKLKKLRPF